MNRMQRPVMVAMPYPAGIGYAWNYIEEVVWKLGAMAAALGHTVYIAYPSGLEKVEGRDAGVRLVHADFYSTRTEDRAMCRDLVRRLQIHTLYYAERQPFSAEFARLRFAGVRRIVVHLHHAGGATGAVHGLARALRLIRASLPLVKADAACCVSEFVACRAAEASCFPRDRLHVVRNAARQGAAESQGQAVPALQSAYDAAESGRPLVVCCSRADREKGIDLLLDAFDIVWRDATKTESALPVLLYCGDGPDLERFREQRDALASRDSIFMPGSVPSADGPLKYAAVAVHYARYEEAFGLFALEAMKVGIPVIVSNLGALPEVVEDGVTGVVVPAESAPQLAIALSAMLADPLLARSLGARGRTRAADEFNFDLMLQRLASCVLS